MKVYHQTRSGQVYRTKYSTNRHEFVAGERAKYYFEQPVHLTQDGLSTHRSPAACQMAGEHAVIPVPTAKHTSWMIPVETHSKGVEELAPPGTEFTWVGELGEALDPAAVYWNEKRKARWKRVRDTVRADRRHASRVPLWLPATVPDVY